MRSRDRSPQGPDLNITPITKTSSFFDKNGIFGAWPTQEQIKTLVDWGLDVIVNLASENERNVVPYSLDEYRNVTLINYPITDLSIPSDKISFCSLVVKVCDFLSVGKKVYIHCKGGHGRSGMLVAAVIAYKNNIPISEAIIEATSHHSKREVMKKKWRDIGAPQTTYQKRFITNLFSDHNTERELSPFKDIENEIETYLKLFLLQTHLGKITGPNGKKLMHLREKLMKTK